MSCRRTLPTMDTVIEGPTCEPLDLEEVKKQRRMSTSVTSLDPLFDLWIAAASTSRSRPAGSR